MYFPIEMFPIVWREMADEFKCDNPDCDNPDHDVIYMNPACHPDGGAEVFYHRGWLCIGCMICKRPVARISVSFEKEHIVDWVVKGDEYGDDPSSN